METLNNLSTYGGRRLSTNVSALGSLGRGEAWIFYEEVLQVPDWVVQAVKEGYVFPFAEEVPPTVDLENNCSSNRDTEFVWAELCRLESLGCIAHVRERSRVILPMSMVFSKKMRLVLDTSRGLNPYILKRDVTLEGWIHLLRF